MRQIYKHNPWLRVYNTISFTILAQTKKQVVENFWDKISVKKLFLNYSFRKNKDIVSLIAINYFIIILFSVVVILLHATEGKLIPVTYRYHTIIILGIIELILIRRGFTLIAKILMLIYLPFLILILPPLANLYDDEFYFWFPYVPIALSILPHFIFQSFRQRGLLVFFLSFYFLLGVFIDDFMLLMSKGEEQIIPFVIENRFYYNLVPLVILTFVNLALGLLFGQNARYEVIMQKQQEELIQSEKMASLGVLTAGIAHEINNPLNFISGSLTAIDSLKDEFFDPDNTDDARRSEILSQRDKLMKASFEGVYRAAEIVKSLKQFSSHGNDQKSNVNIRSIIDSVLMIVHSKIPDYVELIKEYEQIPEIPCFEQKIHQVFMNIVDNAIDAVSDKEKPSKEIIKIGIRKKDVREQAFVSICFENSGTPIPSDHVRKIFDPFFTTKDPGKGVGLGMSISYNIIREHGGMLTVNNKDGMVQFEVLLPIAND